MDYDWITYQKATTNLPVRPLLLEAMKHVTTRNRSLDFGSGSQVDSRFLLNQKFNAVIAVDRLGSYPVTDPRLTFIETNFENYVPDFKSFDLINAQFSLPFVNPEKFSIIWNRLVTSLETGGIIVGQLFGKDDEWASNPDMTFHSIEDVIDMLSPLNLIKIEQKRYVASTAAGVSKKWHVIDFIASLPSNENTAS